MTLDQLNEYFDSIEAEARGVKPKPKTEVTEPIPHRLITNPDGSVELVAVTT